MTTHACLCPTRGFCLGLKFVLLSAVAVACGARSSLDGTGSPFGGDFSTSTASSSGGGGTLSGSGGARQNGGADTGLAGGDSNSGGRSQIGGAVASGGVHSSGAANTGGVRTFGGGSGAGGSTLGGASSLGGTRAMGGGAPPGGSSSGGAPLTGGSSGCVCLPTDSLCWDGATMQCVDTQSDPNHCGACANACQNQGYCQRGRCIKDACELVGLNGQRTVATDEDPVRVKVADLNRDGTLDIVTANNSSSLVTVLLGNGLTVQYSSSTYPCGTQPLSLAIGDLNEDGAPDIVTANATANSLTTLFNDGLGRFPTTSSYSIGSAFYDAYSVALGDLNGDGHLDLVVGLYMSGFVRVLLGNGDGTWSFEGDYPAGEAPLSPIITDPSHHTRVPWWRRTTTPHPVLGLTF